MDNKEKQMNETLELLAILSAALFLASKIMGLGSKRGPRQFFL